MPFADFAELNWQPAQDAKAIPNTLREMILDHHSLTQRLKQIHNNEFFVRVISHDWQEPEPSEKAFLNCDDQHASVREVLLFGSGQPVVFARSVLPVSSLSGENRALLALENRPLGEYIFSQPDLRRGPIEVTDMKASQFNAYLDFEFATEIAWARRSLFYLRERPISVCEVFLPEREQL
ncbi:chorismate lyase [Endozoicomonas sp. SCSIO W0465]|uniref:chorismate--pyruvate lyase family protein n=1 Tax=Endozoicomonas sp. SCSIO W0465 TaxID=2918516 RepID=UPI0020758E46|nr:chorismate lyase [Endozoicomonas sp. SCSIO W0465]USE35916.1 chorismate lyase [Endozoicomonas sp. SCSIO W0465]